MVHATGLRAFHPYKGGISHTGATRITVIYHVRVQASMTPFSSLGSSSQYTDSSHHLLYVQVPTNIHNIKYKS